MTSPEPESTPQRDDDPSFSSSEAADLVENHPALQESGGENPEDPAPEPTD